MPVAGPTSEKSGADVTDNLPAVQSEIAVIQDRMRTDNAGYLRDEAAQARYRDLVETRDSGGAAPAAPSRDSARLAELKALMRDQRSSYWQGSQAKHLQAEYRALLPSQDVGTDRRTAAVVAFRPAAPSKPAADAKHGMIALSAEASVAALNSEPHGRALVASWGKDAVANAGAAIRHAVGILNSMSRDGAAEVVRAVDALSAEDNAALMSWLADAGRAFETR